MAIDEVAGQAWTRKHDNPALPVVPAAPRTVYPKSLEELIELCSKRAPSEKIHAAGSHWALSKGIVGVRHARRSRRPDGVRRAGDRNPRRRLPYAADRRRGHRRNFEIIRDDAVFDSVLISAGRFGILYSIVMVAVCQYCLHQERRLTTWQAIRSQVGNPTSALYLQTFSPPARNRFLQIGISVIPHENFTRTSPASRSDGTSRSPQCPAAAFPPGGTSGAA